MLFSFFPDFSFPGSFVVKVQKMVYNYQFQSLMLYISRTVDHIIRIFVDTQV